MGRPITISIRLDEDLVARIDRLAHRKGSTRSFYVRKILEEQLETLENNCDVCRGPSRILRDDGSIDVE